MKSNYTLVEGKAWCCFSIFYSRKAWTDILPKIISFYHENKGLFYYFQIYLSEDRGEHIGVTFSSSVMNMAVVQIKVNEFFSLFLKNSPSTNSKEFPFGKELWCYYPNNSLIWNQYRIQYPNLESLLDEDIISCLSCFLKSDCVEDKGEMEEEGFVLLQQIQRKVATEPSGIGLAKWGCLVECLVQNSLIEADLDDLLFETDEFLIAIWQEVNSSYVGIPKFLLWMGDYFLFRLFDEQSRFHFRSSQMLEQMIPHVEQLFKPECSDKYVEPILLFPIGFWYDLEWWLVQVDKVYVCESTKKILRELYAFPEMNVSQCASFMKDSLRWQLRSLCWW